VLEGSFTMSRRIRLMRAFLWVSVLAWGIGVGAKLYDLRVVAGAWSAAPPQSLTLLPYGPRFPVDPGKFFIPTSLSTLVSAFGALLSGWKTPFRYRVWLWSSAALILAVWVFTAVAFWPSNAALYAGASAVASDAQSKAELIRLAHQWVTYDWWRVAMMAAGFVSAVKAISIPVPPAPN
jgi:anthrone oxygenase-like protein